jgi:putative ABC transport system ATP-binding protein
MMGLRRFDDTKAGHAAPVADMFRIGCRLGREFCVVIERLQLRAGEVLVLDSPSGTGKSTVLGLIAGVVPAEPFEAGHHRLFGRPVKATAERGLPRAAELGFVLQGATLVPYLTVSQNIGLPARVAGCSVSPGWRENLLQRLGIAGLHGRYPDEISIGQRQRVAIARAMLTRPRLLLMDEPVSALDPSNLRQVENLILDLAREASSAVLLASHQVARSAFAGEHKAQHRLVEQDGVTYSLFSHAGEGGQP